MFNRFENDLKETVEMWQRFVMDIPGYGYHISNSRLYVLMEMIKGRIEANNWGEDVYHKSLYQIFNLAAYAKSGTAKEKIIYCHVMNDWLSKIVQEIAEKHWRESKSRDTETEPTLDQSIQLPF